MCSSMTHTSVIPPQTISYKCITPHSWPFVFAFAAPRPPCAAIVLRQHHATPTEASREPEHSGCYNYQQTREPCAWHAYPFLWGCCNVCFNVCLDAPIAYSCLVFPCVSDSILSAFFPLISLRVGKASGTTFRLLVFPQREKIPQRAQLSDPLCGPSHTHFILQDLSRAFVF